MFCTYLCIGYDIFCKHDKDNLNVLKLGLKDTLSLVILKNTLP